MIKGIDKVDISSCTNAQAGQRLRRPDDHGPRPQPELQRRDRLEGGAGELPDEFQFIVDANADDILQQGRGRRARRRGLEHPAAGAAKYATTPSLEPHFHQNSGDRTWYLTMNLTQPPFDDIHVRKAMNWIMDKHALVQAWGGPTIGKRREPHRPGHAVQQPARRVRAVQDARRPRQRREGEGGDEGLEVRHERQRHLQRERVQERAPDRRHPRGRHEDAAGDRRQTRRRSASPSRCARSRARTRRSRRRRRTSRSPSARAGARTTPTRDLLHARCSTVARSSRTATRTTRSSASRPRWQEGRRQGQRAPTCRASTRQLDRCAD